MGKCFILSCTIKKGGVAMSNPYPMEERRKFRRVKASSIINLRVFSMPEADTQFSSLTFDGIMIDICEGGLGFLTDQSLPPQSTITARFTLFTDYPLIKEHSRVIEPRGEIRYAKKIEERSYRLGVSFMNIPGDDRSYIANLVKWA
jgi:c-di-GMP-binding flagellar brake protein YcgR